jgi:hypothetical protein
MRLQSLYFDLIRVYYYDAVFENIKLPANSEIMGQIKRQDNHEFRFGRLKKGSTIRQKGVDTLIAIDMLSKAYQDPI